MKVYNRVIAAVSKISANFSMVIILAMMFLTVADVFLRYLFNKPIKWNFDLQTLLIVVVVYLGIPYVQTQRGHIRINILSSRLSETSRIWLRFFSDLIFFGFVALITWQMSLQTWNAWVIKDYLESIVRVLIWPGKAAVTLGTGLVALNLISQIVQDIQELLNARRAPGARSGWYLRLAAIITVWAILIAATFWITLADVQPVTVGWIAIILLFVLLLAETPIAVAAGILTIWGTFILSGGKAALAISGSQPFQFMLSYMMTVVPLFIAMGTLAGVAGFATNAYEAARRWLQGIPGGLVHATIVGVALFSAASGTSTASCAAFAKMILPEMLRLGVQKALALGAVACAATMDVMIPPSVTLVTYALLTQQSVGKLLIAGIIPGALQALLYMGLVFIRCKLDPSLIPKGASFSWKEKFASILPSWGLLFIIIVVMGGIYTGIFTPIEAGALGCFAALVGVAITGKLKSKDLREALFGTVSLTSSVLFIIVGGMMFGTLLAQSRFPIVMSEYLASLNIPPLIILIAIMIFYLIIGCFMDALSILIITLPIVFPLIVRLGYDPIWFGILITITVEVALVSPPYGLNLFVMQATVPNIKLGELYRGVFWFLIVDVLFLALVIAFPGIATWLPSMMFK